MVYKCTLERLSTYVSRLAVVTDNRINSGKEHVATLLTLVDTDPGSGSGAVGTLWNGNCKCSSEEVESMLPGEIRMRLSNARYIGVRHT